MEKTVAARLSQHDREIAAIRKLVLTGMKMLVQIEKTQKETDRQLLLLAGEHAAVRREMRELRAAQRETERSLQGLIRSLQRGSNGRGPTSH